MAVGNKASETEIRRPERPEPTPTGKEPQSPPVVDFIRSALAALLVIGPILWIVDVPRMLGFALYTEQLLTFALAMTLPLLFLSLGPNGQPQARPRWYDIVAAAAGFGAAAYLTFRYATLINEIVYLPPEGVVIATTLCVLSVEGVRRSAGWALAIIVLTFIVFALWGHLLPAPFTTREVTFARLAVYLGLDTNALLGTALQVAVVVIIPFVLLGKLLASAGGSDFFTALAVAGMGRYRGGAGKIAVVGSSLFGSISGSAVANVVGTGVVTIPLMKRAGFPAPLAAGIEAVASTGGQLMPPVIGAAAFLMAEFLVIPYSEVMLAALLPILLYYVAVFIQVDLLAARLGIAAVPKEEIPSAWTTFRQGGHFLLPFGLFIYCLFALNLQPELAALYAVLTLLATSLVFGYRGRRPSLRDLWIVLRETGESSLEIVIITAAAGLVIGVLNLTGLAFSMSMQILALAGGNILLLMLLVAISSIVLGMGMPTVGVYVLLATLIAPAMVEAGVLPIAAHMFVLYFGMLSMVTPPVAIASFAAANLAGADPWRASLDAVRLGWTAYIVPFLFVLSPSLLLIGDIGESIQAAITAIVGVAMISAAMAGYAIGRIGWAMRIWLAVAGIALFVPANAFEGAMVLEIAGIVLAVLAALKIFLLDRRGPSAAREAGTLQKRGHS